jgi:acyl-CoA synthetase (AMP-forming)/AMP-acid ligase II
LQGVAIRWGYLLVALNNRLSAPELSRLLQDSRVAVLVAGADEHDLALSAVASLDDPPMVWHLGAGSPGYLDIVSRAEPCDGLPPDDPGLAVSIMYTGGTTGAPKGVVVDRVAMSARILTAAAEMNLSRDDVWLQILPMFHIASGPPYACLARGASVVLLDRFTPQGVVDHLVRWQCTMTVLVPTMIDVLLRHLAEHPARLEQLRYLGYGAAPIDAQLLERMITTFDCEFQQWYGQTELGGVTALHHRDHDLADRRALGSVGLPMLGYEVSIRDDAGVPVASGQVGEIACRGPGAMSGYWNRSPVDVAFRDGWLPTGDMGRFDERGFLHLVDRRNNMIITGGENVYPAEVESVLATAPGVDDVVVLGMSDTTWGQIVAAVYVGTAAVEDLAAHASRQLAAYKVPRLWLSTVELPRTAMGKVSRTTLSDLMAEALSDGRAVRHGLRGPRSS